MYITQRKKNLFLRPSKIQTLDSCPSQMYLATNGAGEIRESSTHPDLLTLLLISFVGLKKLYQIMIVMMLM